VSEAAVPDFVREELGRIGVELPEPALASLAKYLDLLLEANQRFNLTAIRERDAAWHRHIIDSRTLAPALVELEAESTLIDVGSGGGLPGVPLAIARPDLRLTLLEATGKKARFLEECAQRLPLPSVRVLATRAETAGQDKAFRQQFDVAVCRAVGPMRELLEYTLPLVRVGGMLLAMKGPKAEAELAEAGDALDALGGGELQVYSAYPEGFGLDTVIISVIKDRPTPKGYPRAPGTPRQAPL
jgi:16S rRNA (guanine527-N7)-methyltransferase